MEQGELDAVLRVIENPVRRRIIKRLSQEPCYALQLSKELGLGQPLVAKHLTIMEKAGLAASTMESSPSGPARKRYFLAKSVSIRMDLAPNLFLEKASAFGEPHAREKGARQVSALSGRFKSALGRRDDGEKLSLLSEILKDVDGVLEDVEGERVALLGVRDAAMSEASRIARRLDDLDTKRVLYHILDEHDREVASISESLNLREMTVRAILDELARDIFG